MTSDMIAGVGAATLFAGLWLWFGVGCALTILGALVLGGTIWVKRQG